jgi:two-component system sensor histidine kinase KdpD
MRRIWDILINGNRVVPYLLAIINVVIVTAGLYFIRDRMEIAIVVLLYLLPVGASAAIGGLGPGIVAALVAFFSLNYFFLPPYGTLKVHQSQDILVLVVFLVLAISISQLVGRMTNSLATARARENETTRLYELSLALSRLHSESDIINHLAQHTLDTFQADQVEVFTEGEPQPVLVRLTKNTAEELHAPGQPTTLVSLQGRQHLRGEIRLWRHGRTFNQAEMRLLRTYAHQAALAVERAILAGQARRAELLQVTEKLQTSLLNSISHDLRTPLVSITGALSSLRERSLSLDQDARDSLLETAYEEAERLNRLVGNLLNMTRIEAGAIHLNKELCDLQDVIGAALEQLGERIERRQVKVNLPPKMDLIAMDMALFEQVLVNLLDNAVKYSPPGEPIEINVSPAQKTVRIEICDRGIGIPPGDLEHVFDKFYRVKRPESVSGTGLGLAICKGIVEAHGGMVHAENRVGSGTVIRIDLPKELNS